MQVWVLHGPNLNMLGRREPETYGTTTLAEVDEQLVARGAAMGVTVVCKQSNHEGQLIDWIHEAYNANIGGFVINPGGLTHTSVALRDAVAMLTCTKIEVHLSNVWKREAFRHHSFISPVVDGVIGGLGADGYQLALQAVVRKARRP